MIRGSFSLDTSGLERDMDKETERRLKRLEQGLQSLANATMTKSKADYVPVLTGNLRASGKVDPIAERNGDLIEVTLGFSASYAEEIEFTNKSPIGRKPERPKAGRLFLTRAMMETAARADEVLREWMRG